VTVASRLVVILPTQFDESIVVLIANARSFTTINSHFDDNPHHRGPHRTSQKPGESSEKPGRQWASCGQSCGQKVDEKKHCSSVFCIAPIRDSYEKGPMKFAAHLPAS
jgi:hypothetical protein